MTKIILSLEITSPGKVVEPKNTYSQASAHLVKHECRPTCMLGTHAGMQMHERMQTPISHDH